MKTTLLSAAAVLALAACGGETETTAATEESAPMDKAAQLDAVLAGDHRSEEERARWREALQPMMESYLASVKDEGVDNGAEIYQAMQDKIAEFEAAQD